MANTNSTKVTKRDMFNALLAIEGVNSNQSLVDFINHEIELLDKKRDNRKPTKTQVKNDTLKATVLNVITTLGSATVTEMQSANAELSGLSNQKVSALVRQLKEDGLITKETIKGKSVFSLA